MILGGATSIAVIHDKAQLSDSTEQVRRLDQLLTSNLTSGAYGALVRISFELVVLRTVTRQSLLSDITWVIVLTYLSAFIVGLASGFSVTTCRNANGDRLAPPPTTCDGCGGETDAPMIDSPNKKFRAY